MAEMQLNGKNLGILWKASHQLNITKVASIG
jgi:hypothetical protein